MNDVEAWAARALTLQATQAGLYGARDDLHQFATSACALIPGLRRGRFTSQGVAP